LDGWYKCVWQPYNEKYNIQTKKHIPDYEKGFIAALKIYCMENIFHFSGLQIGIAPNKID
jgi:hypothetical protein